MLRSGSAGVDAQREVVGACGGEVESAYALSGGRFDAAVVVTFPSEEACLAFTLAASATGQYAEAMRALDPACVDSAREIAAAAQRALTPEDDVPDDTAPESGSGSA